MTNKKSAHDTINKIEWVDLLFKTASTIVSGIVIAIFGLYIWKQQFMTTQQQKTYDTKVEVFKKLSADGGKMIHYSEFMIRTKLELYQYFENDYDSSFRPDQDHEIYEKTMRYQLKIQKEKPILYSEYMKGLEFQSDFMSTLLLTKTVFEPCPELDSLRDLFTEEAIIETLKVLNKGSLPKIFLANKEQVVNVLRKKQISLLSKILESLYTQIKYAEQTTRKFNDCLTTLSIDARECQLLTHVSRYCR
jgi:hypothetical protein